MTQIGYFSTISSQGNKILCDKENKNKINTKTGIKFLWICGPFQESFCSICHQQCRYKTKHII